MEEMIDILGLPLDCLEQVMQEKYGKGPFHAHALYREVFKKGGVDIGAAPEFKGSPRLWAALENKMILAPGQVEKTIKDGELVKFITRLSDDLKIESVVIPMTRHKHPVCLQPGGMQNGVQILPDRPHGIQTKSYRV